MNDIKELNDDLVTICITHYNRIERLKNTISAIYRNTPNVFKIRIFNDGLLNNEIDKYLAELEQRDEITVIRYSQNIGPVAARNHLLEGIQTPFTLTLDDDMYVDKEWFEDALKIFNENKEIGFVGFPFESTSDEDVANTRNIKITNGIINVEKRNPNLNSIDSNYIVVDEVATGAMMIRSTAIEDFQFDSSYKIGFGDLDKTLQILNTKWKQVLVTDHCFTHDKKKINSEYQKGGEYINISNSYRHFSEKWGVRYPLKKHIMFKYIYRMYAKMPQSIRSIIQQL